jgi:hypothetical protein
MLIYFVTTTPHICVVSQFSTGWRLEDSNHSYESWMDAFLAALRNCIDQALFKRAAKQ